VQKRFHKPVIFTEAGFPIVAGANLQPWEDGKPGKAALQFQARCYQAVFRAFYNKPWFERMLVEGRNERLWRSWRHLPHTLGQARDGRGQEMV